MRIVEKSVNMRAMTEIKVTIGLDAVLDASEFPDFKLTFDTARAQGFIQDLAQLCAKYEDIFEGISVTSAENKNEQQR